MTPNILVWLEEWYAHQCDGDWEHDYRIHIQTLDNPGWRVRINLQDTIWAARSFDTYERDSDETNWVRCWVANETFEGAGGPHNLHDILQIFYQWVTQEDESV